MLQSYIDELIRMRYYQYYEYESSCYIIKLNISQSLQENTITGISLFKKFQAIINFIKKVLLLRFFSVNFLKTLGTVLWQCLRTLIRKLCSRWDDETLI